MTSTEILATLKKAGKPQTAAIYKRYGTGDNVFGTLTSEIGKLQKKVKVSDADASKVLATIEKQIHKSPNWARYAMNSAVIAIGVWKPNVRNEAIAAATRIGKVDVDHGETHCKTPEAVSYIKKSAKRAT